MSHPLHFTSSFVLVQVAPAEQSDANLSGSPIDDELYLTIQREEELLAAKRVAERSDTEPDLDAQPLGAGPRGKGPPLRLGSFERERQLCDGAGFCSLGCWEPHRRPQTTSPTLLQLRAFVNETVQDLEALLGYGADEFFDKMADGQFQECPPRRGPTSRLSQPSLQDLPRLPLRRDRSPRGTEGGIAPTALGSGPPGGG